MDKLINQILEKTDVVVISNNVIKNKIVEKVSEKKKLINITYKSFSQVVEDIIGVYSTEARIRLQLEKKISVELASIKIRNSLLVNDSYTNEKIKDLLSIKSKYSKYLDLNPLAINIYKGKTIFVINDYQVNDLFNKALEIIAKSSKVISYNTTKKIDKEIIITSFPNIKLEVLNLSKEIAKLIEKGIDPSHIKVHSFNNDYIPYVKEVFGLTNIDIELSSKSSLYEYELTKQSLKILDNYLDLDIEEGFQKTVIELKNKIRGQNPLYNSIISVFNKYLIYSLKVKDIYSDLVYSLKHAKSNQIIYRNVIQESNLLDEMIDENDHVFILGFNQDIFPRTYLNDDFLLDFEKEKFNLVTSKFKNHQEKVKSHHLIDSIKNLYISYSEVIGNSKVPKSSFINELKKYYEVKEETYNHDFSLSYSKELDLLQLGKKLDLYFKYDIKGDELFTLYSNYSDNLYRKYSHKFSSVDRSFLDKFLKKDLRLSYTSIDQYYKCGFLYYLERILKIRRSTNDEALYIGNLFHEVLNYLLMEDVVVDIDLFLDNTINEYLKKVEKIPTKKELFFIDKYKDVIKKLYSNLNNQSKNCEFDLFGLEKEFTITIDKKYKVIINGKIDKVLVLSINEQKYAIVLDYKSGSTDIDLNRIVHGLNMQLMFYFYFLNKFSDEKYHFGGGYLQGILPTSAFNRDSKYTYEQQFNNHFKLMGYSNINHNILQKIDCNFDNEDHYVYGIKMKSDGSFYSYSMQRLLTDSEFEKLMEIVEEKINQAIEGIISGKFDINPKKLGNFDSCSYCPYLDICYREKEDYQELTQYKNFEFIRGGEDK